MMKRVLTLLMMFCLPVGFATSTAQTVFLNELHYDNTGTDTDEALELAGPAGYSVDGWQVVLYNGNGGTEYARVSVSGTFPNTCDGLGVLAFSHAGIQNGSPDGLALVDAAGTTVQFLSYEGGFVAVDGPAAGMTSEDIEVAESSSTTRGQSLQLAGSGVRYDHFGWQLPFESTFGSCNYRQQFGLLGHLDAGGSPASTGITFNEISAVSEIDFNADGVSASQGDMDEFIEIVNAGSSAVDLNGWVLGDNFDAYTFGGLEPLQPNQFVVVFTRGADVSNFDPGPGNQVLSLGDLALDNERDAIGLLGPQGDFISVSWGYGPDSRLSSAFDTTGVRGGIRVKLDSAWVAGTSQTRVPDYNGGWAHHPEIEYSVWSLDGSITLESPRASPGRSITGITLSVDPQGPRPKLAFDVFPNPASAWIGATAILDRPSRAETRLFSIDGRLVRRSVPRPVQVGELRIVLPITGLSAGVYFVELALDGRSASRTVVVVR